MSNFTVKEPSCPILVTLSEDTPGQVDIWLQSPDGRKYRLLAISGGKLHLSRFGTQTAKQLGLKLDGVYPVTERV